jgi:hypothetical protein
MSRGYSTSPVPRGDRGRAAFRDDAVRTLLTLLFACMLSAPAIGADYRIPPGTGRFDFPFFAEGRTKTIVVWYHRAAAAGPDAPVLFVMHGRGRNGATYRKYWIPHADAANLILLVPEFTQADFGETYQYQFGYVATTDAAPVPEKEWSFTAVEDLFEAVRRANGLTARQYDIYGHSAGAQFVHRMLFLKPSARIRTAVSANAGSYTMPDTAAAYPYGLSGAPVATGGLAAALGKRLVVLLGADDTDPHHRSLPRAPEAMQQGPHRYARGQAFFARARESAARLEAPLNWTLATVPGVGHSNALMASHAAAFVGGAD